MLEVIYNAMIGGRMYVRQVDKTLAKLKFAEFAFVSPNKQRYKLRAKLPCGTPCEVTQDSSIHFTSSTADLPKYVAYVVLS